MRQRLDGIDDLAIDRKDRTMHWQLRLGIRQDNMNYLAKSHGIASLIVITVLWLFGCAGTPHFDDPLAVMLDRQRGPAVRLAAVEQLGSIEQNADPQAYHDALTAILYSDRQPPELRNVAIDRLIEYEAAAFWGEIDDRIDRIGDWAVLEHLFDRAASEQQVDFTRTAVKSYARPSQRYSDDRRPERELIAKLNPGTPVDELLWRVLAGRFPGTQPTDQLAAWEVLGRTVPQPVLRQRLLELEKSDSLIVASLRSGAEVLGELPVSGQGLLWLTTAQTTDDWSRTIQLADTLDADQRQRLALRHLPALRRLSDPSSLTRGNLERHISGRLQRATHFVREDRIGAAWTEAWDVQTGRLCWGDLVVIDAIQRAMADHAVVEAWFVQAEQDRHDAQSEHGGGLLWSDGRVIATAFEPSLRMHDRQYVAPVSLISQLYDGLAHYHFHTQRFDNAAFAAPGGGDLAFIDRFGFAGLVLTYVDQHTLNVDYYQPGGVVIDLGVVRRDADD